MGSSELSYIDYVKAAFNLKLGFGPLGGLSLNRLLLTGFAILGIAHPGFWLLGLGLESAYLLFLPGNPRFQNIVKGQQMLQTAGRREIGPEDLLVTLSPSARRIFQDLAEKCNKLTVSASDAAGALDELKAARLNELLWVFLKLLVSNEKMSKLLEQTSIAKIESEIKQISEKLEEAGESSPLHRSLQSTLEIHERRLDNLKRASENIKVASAEIERIKTQVALLTEENAVSADPAAFTSRLDGVTQSLQETSRWMSDNSDLFASFDEAPPSAGCPAQKENA